MEQEEKEQVTEVDSRQKARETFDIDGVGEFRAKPGTAVAELAGAASYWNKKAKELESKLESHGKRRWIDGFISGVVVVFSSIAIVSALFHFVGR